MVGRESSKNGDFYKKSGKKNSFGRGFLKKDASAKKVAKKEIKKDIFERKMVSFLFTFVAITLSLLSIFLVSNVSMEGYATVDAGAGDIIELTLYRKFPTNNWVGVYGLALRVSDFTEQLFGDFSYGEVTRQDLFFDCVQSNAVGGNEVYVATSPSIDFDNLEPASAELVDDYTGCSGELYCATGTFVEETDIVVGGRNISNVPAVYTYKWDGDNEIFDTGLLWDGTQLVYATHIQEMQKSFDEEKIVNYQVMLPVPVDGEETFYFFTDPYDECPAGSGFGENIVATVSGYVSDSLDNPLSNVSVVVAGTNVTSDNDGYYSLNFSVVPGEYNLFAERNEFDDYFSKVNITYENFSIEHNFTMNRYTPGIDEVVSVSAYGYVYDGDGNSVVDSKVLLGDSVVYTNLSGGYSLTSSVTLGEHSLVALKEGFNNAHETLNVTVEDNMFNRDLVLEKVTQDYSFETGPYTEEPVSQEIVEEVLARGEDYWISTKKIDKEVRQNTFVEDEIGIYNLRKTPMTLSFQVSPEISDFVKIDRLAASINQDNYINLKVSILGTKPVGTYEGVIRIMGDLEQEIPVKVRVVDKKFSVEALLMEADVFSGVAEPGKDMRYKLSMQNLLRDQNYQVDLSAKIRGLEDGEVYLEDEFSAEIENSLTLLKDISIPENFTTGDYVLEVEADYLGRNSLVTTSFVVSRPIYMYSFFGVPLWMIFSIVSFLGFVSLNLLMYKRYLDKKKRYRIQIEYSTLPEPGDRVIKLGNIAESNHPAYYEIDKLTTHAIVAGATGMGKSISAQVMIEECLLQGISVMVFDPTAQWSGMLRKCTDKGMLSFYSKFGMKKKDARAFKGNVRMIKNHRQKLDINKYFAPGQIQIFSMNKLTPNEIDVFVSNVIKQVFRADPKENPNLKTLLVFDEVHRLLPKFGGSGAGFLQIERACREFRKWGLGVMLISQVLNDFAGQIKANINTELQARTLEEGDLERIRSKYGEEFLKSLVRAEVGVIMFQNADYNRGRPYFLNFRPILHSTRRLTDEELEQYNKYNDLVDEIEYQVEGLTKEKVDTFDLKMELKLIKDKIMSGSFSVVEIYLEGLKPRVEKEWEKLGKEPPKMELELVDEKEMAEDDARLKAQKEKEEADKKK